MKTPTDAGADEAFAVAVVEVAREASTEATGELVARSYFDTALAQLEFRRLGGAARQRETRRYEVTHVPAPLRRRDRAIGVGEPVLAR